MTSFFNLHQYFPGSWKIYQSKINAITSLAIVIKFPLAPMGVLAPGSAHARPSARPPMDTSGNFGEAGRFGFLARGRIIKNSVSAEGLACADPGARTPIGASGNSSQIFSRFSSQMFGPP